jgi:hypothetical protein
MKHIKYKEQYAKFVKRLELLQMRHRNRIDLIESFVGGVLLVLLLILLLKI